MKNEYLKLLKKLKYCGWILLGEFILASIVVGYLVFYIKH